MAATTPFGPATSAGPAARSTPLDPLYAVLAGAGAGIVGGVVFGMLMQMMMPPVIGMIGSLVGAPSLGWLVHLVFSAIIGAGFGVTLAHLISGWSTAVGYGLVYGFIWWILGPLLIMPVWLGMGPQFGMAITGNMLMSLMGHLIFGAIAGAVFKATADRL